jgi:hypothetical protein
VLRRVAVLLPESGTLAGQMVSGTFNFVPYGAVATRLVVLAEDNRQSLLGVVDPNGMGVKRAPLKPLDHGPAALITLDGAPLRVITDGADAVRRHRDAPTALARRTRRRTGRRRGSRQ